MRERRPQAVVHRGPSAPFAHGSAETLRGKMILGSLYAAPVRRGKAALPALLPRG
jgi:hypothetical protein